MQGKVMQEWRQKLQEDLGRATAESVQEVGAAVRLLASSMLRAT